MEVRSNSPAKRPLSFRKATLGRPALGAVSFLLTNYPTFCQQRASNRKIGIVLFKRRNPCDRNDAEGLLLCRLERENASIGRYHRL